MFTNSVHISTLDCACLDKCLLERMQSICLAPALIGMFAKPFDGDDVMSLGLRGEYRPGVDRLAIEQDRIRPGESLLIAEFDAVVAKSAHGSEESFGGGAVNLMIYAIDS